MGTSFSVSTTRQFLLASWKRHPSCLGMCGELLCQWQCWPSLLEGDTVVSVTGEDRGGCGSNKEKSVVPGTQRYFVMGVSLKKQAGHWCVVGCGAHLKPINRITDFLFTVTFRKRSSSAVRFHWLFSN